MACEGFGRQRGHRSGMKLLLGLPEFTSGFDVHARSSPFGRWPVMPGRRDLTDVLARLPTHEASGIAGPLPRRRASGATKLARRVHLQSAECARRFREQPWPCLYRRPRCRLSGDGASITVRQQENLDDQSQCHVPVRRRRALRPCLLPRYAHANGETAARRGMPVLHGGQGYRRRRSRRGPCLRRQV
ncbi:hypothetical protein P355_3455 [Burkholderia cenocepacia KC-01]|nr:hypothetical protein P355_3455 [Burkholderia cenocepacia KC-01]